MAAAGFLVQYCEHISIEGAMVHGTPRCAGETQSLCKIANFVIGFGKSTSKPNQAELVGMCDKT